MQTLNTADVRRRFDRAAAEFDTADFVHSVTREGLFSRLAPVSVEASLVLDIGCATGSALRPLEKRFRKARVVGVDLSGNMLQHASRHCGWFSRTSLLQANARALPFADASVDVVFANMLLPWIDDPASLASEVARVLRENGLFAFATLGPDSLLQLERAWAGAGDENQAHVNRFFDMHDVGDALVRAGLRDPVLDVDRLAVTYEDPDTLFRDLTRAGARNSLAERRSTLSGRQRFDAMRRCLGSVAETGKIQLDMELVYGHCWGAAPRSDETAVRIDPTSIGLRRR